MLIDQMKFYVLSKEKDIIVVDPRIIEVSISLRFIKNQVNNKKNQLVVLNLNLIKSHPLLKLIEFCKYQYIKYKKKDVRYFMESDFENILGTHIKSNQFQWYKNFVQIDISLMAELLNFAHFLIIKELVELSLRGIATIFIKRVNEFRITRKEKTNARKKDQIFN